MGSGAEEILSKLEQFREDEIILKNFKRPCAVAGFSHRMKLLVQISFAEMKRDVSVRPFSVTLINPFDFYVQIAVLKRLYMEPIFSQTQRT